MRESTPTNKPTTARRVSRPKNKRSSCSPNSNAKRVAGALNRSKRKFNTKIVIPRGRKISKPVRKALRNFREKLVGLADDTISWLCLRRITSEKKIRPTIQLADYFHGPSLFASHDFSVHFFNIIKSHQVQPSMY